MDTSREAFLFSYFTGEGEDGLHLATSRNGLEWTPLNDGKSYLTPQVGSKVMRDPCLVRGPDGTFHLVWTTGWWDKGIGIAHTRDLRTWSEQTFVAVMEHEPAARNAWAPEIFYDASRRRFLIYWSTTIPGRFPGTDPAGDLHDGRQLNHRLYYVTTTDFETFSPTHLLYDGGFNVIDGTIVAVDGRFAMIVKDETKVPVARKHLRVTFAQRPDGPWGAAGPPFTPDWVEGPSALKVDDGWIVYFDEYTRKRYGAMKTADFERWLDVSASIRFPAGARHGSALAVPEEVITSLLQGAAR